MHTRFTGIEFITPWVARVEVAMSVFLQLGYSYAFLIQKSDVFVDAYATCQKDSWKTLKLV